MQEQTARMKRCVGLNVAIAGLALLFAGQATGEKSGSCPELTGFGICIVECASDDDCSGNLKCCSNGCGLTCQQPLSGQKPGKCPSPNPTGLTTCAFQCKTDDDCSGTFKCCSHGCGTTCQAPASDPKPGRCPIPTGAGICVEECVTDDDCSEELKCCSNGCGTTCQRPRSGRRLF